MGQTRFEPAEYYRTTKPYKMLPFQFLQFESGRKLLVNEVGEHLLVTDAEFSDLVKRRLVGGTSLYSDLKAKHFIFDSDSLVPFELLVTKYRTKKSFLAGFTSLHIFVVSLRCEHSCHYCQVSRVTVDKERYDMSPESARRSLDLVFQSPSDHIKIEFQGGEPLLNFPRIQQVIEEAEARKLQSQKTLDFVVCTNLALIDGYMLEYFKQHNVVISTSLDGPAFIHNANRPRPEANSHELLVQNLEKSRMALGPDKVSALMTTTRLSLGYAKEIIDEYVRLKFDSVFLRPLSPYGFALKTVLNTGYSLEEFLPFYVNALDYILELNGRGTYFVEDYARLILTRILTPYATGYVDLQSPAGAGIGVAVYNYDGNVYASDEARMLAEMGDTTFKLGNVHSDSYETIFGGEVIQDLVANSIVESMPGCADCAFQSWCGADPIHNYATQGELVGHRPSSDFHHRNFFTIKHLLDRYYSDPSARRIFWSWLNPVAGINMR